MKIPQRSTHDAFQAGLVDELSVKALLDLIAERINKDKLLFDGDVGTRKLIRVDTHLRFETRAETRARTTKSAAG